MCRLSDADDALGVEQSKLSSFSKIGATAKAAAPFNASPYLGGLTS